MKNILFFIIISLSMAGCQNDFRTADYVQSGPNRIAVSQSGKGDTTLLFVHGWGINRSYWKAQVDFFSGRYRVVALDLPGFGDSGKTLDSNWHFGKYTEDVKTVITELGLKNVVLIGHSMSGDLILDMDKRYPSLLIGIVGVDNLQEPAPILSETGQAEMDSFFRMMSKNYDSIVKLYMPVQLFQPATDTAIRERVMKDILSNDPVLATDILKENSLFAGNQADAMQSLHHPLLLVNSDVYPVHDSLLKLYCAKGYRLELIPGSGHYPMLEQPDRFNKALQRLLDRLGQ